MKKREIKNDKAGQFYLIATIILAGLIISLTLINNSSSSKDPADLKELAEQLKIEGEEVLDYDFLNSDNKFEEFSRDYSIYAGEDKKIYFIVGEEGDLQVYRYEGATKIPLTGLTTTGSTIVFNLDDASYEFKKEKGKNFYFLITQEEGGEKYVLSN
jgi:hypothetical protein